MVGLRVQAGRGIVGRAIAENRVQMVRDTASELGDDDAFVFGRETAGLPAAILAEFPPARRLRLPMRPHNRSLNLSNAVAVVVFEAWRQQGFAGGS